MKPRYALAAAALMIGSAVNYFGDRLTGFQIEVWTGLAYFSGAMLLDVFIVPFVAGIVVALVFGQGGKWLCYFAPLIVRVLAYARLAMAGDAPPGGTQMNMVLWAFFVILAVEAAAFGGILGEVYSVRAYRRSEEEKARERIAPPGDGPA